MQRSTGSKPPVAGVSTASIVVTTPCVDTSASLYLCTHTHSLCGMFPFQSVTGAKFVDDVNSYWVVKGPHGEQRSRG